MSLWLRCGPPFVAAGGGGAQDFGGSWRLGRGVFGAALLYAELGEVKSVSLEKLEDGCCAGAVSGRSSWAWVCRGLGRGLKERVPRMASGRLAQLVISLLFLVLQIKRRVLGQSLNHHEAHIARKDLEFLAWLPTFKSADPQYQDVCTRILLAEGERPGNSQWGQDAFIFFNIFKYWPMSGKRGFYVDSGANDAREISNTWFFDRCLGWKGLCVEPNPQYHAGIRANRSCTLVPECISASHETVNFHRNGVLGEVTKATTGSSSDVVATQCSPLADMLKLANRSTVDFWSLDVEGYEMTVLKAINYTATPISILLVEDFWISSRQLDLHLTKNGFFKFHHLAIDSVFVDRNFAVEHQPLLSTKIWYPKSYENDIYNNNAYRVGSKDRLNCL